MEGLRGGRVGAGRAGGLGAWASTAAEQATRRGGLGRGMGVEVSAAAAAAAAGSGGGGSACWPGRWRRQRLGGGSSMEGMH